MTKQEYNWYGVWHKEDKKFILLEYMGKDMLYEFIDSMHPDDSHLEIRPAIVTIQHDKELTASNKIVELVDILELDDSQQIKKIEDQILDILFPEKD